MVCCTTLTIAVEMVKDAFTDIGKKIFKINKMNPIIPKEEHKQEIDLTNLCYHDKRNPDCSVDDEDIEDHKKSLLKKNTKCSCDNCFYGRTELTEQLIWQAATSQEQIKDLQEQIEQHKKIGQLYKSIIESKNEYISVMEKNISDKETLIQKLLVNVEELLENVEQMVVLKKMEADLDMIITE
jgi:hypothetical protein